MKMLTEKENINFYMFDTTNKSEREISFEVVDTILNNMRTYYINKLNEEFNKQKEFKYSFFSLYIIMAYI